MIGGRECVLLLLRIVLGLIVLQSLAGRKVSGWGHICDVSFGPIILEENAEVVSA